MLCALVGVSLPLTATAKNWNIGSGAWNSPTNWSPVGVPTAGEAVNLVFADGVARTVTLNTNTPALGLVTIDLTGAGVAARSTLELPNANNLTAAGIFVGGHNGAGFTAGHGTLTQSVGTITTSAGSDLYLGLGAGSTGVYNLSGGALNANLSTVVGSFGTGSFNHSGGIHTLFAEAIGGALLVGYQAGSIGAYNLSGSGQLTSNKHEFIGHEATGSFNQISGSNTIAGAGYDLILGNQATGNGTYTISGGTLTVADDVIVGQAGTGTLNISGTGVVSVNDQLSIGAGDVVNLSGGTLRFNNYNRVATGQFNFTGGTLQLGGNRTIGSDATIADLFGPTPTIGPGKTVVLESTPDVRGNVNVNGGSLRSIDGYRMGEGNSASVNISSGGSVTAIGITTIGSVTNSSWSGTLAVAGTGSNFTSTEETFVGNVANGWVDIDSGGAVVTDSGVLGNNTNVRGLLTLDDAGSSWTTTNHFTVGGSGWGEVTVGSGARLHVGTQLNINSHALTTFTLNGGAVRFNTLSDPANKLKLNTGTIQLAGNRDLATDAVVTRFFGVIPTLGPGRNLTIEGTATVSTGLSIQGGTLKVGSLNLGAAPFHFSGGVLEVTGGSVSLPNGTVAVPTGGQFRALGTISQRISGAAGSIITATGALTMGLAFNYDGFYTGGQLAVGPHSVTLLDFNDAVFDSGSLITIGVGASSIPGALSAANGLTLDFGGNVVGFGTITTPNNVAKPLINNGHITGFSSVARITLPGYVKGAGTFDNVNFTGTFAPGLSPTSMVVGNVGFSNSSLLAMEIGGTSPGSSYDQILSSGALTLDGALQVTLINGFNPAAGQSFNLFDWNSVSGTFDSLNLPALGGGLSWNTSQLYTTGVLSVSSAGLPGDYNNNGVVDAADYTLYRDALGTNTALANDTTPGTVTVADYAVWQTNFGQTLSASAASAVPEPATWILALILWGVGYVVRPLHSVPTAISLRWGE